MCDNMLYIFPLLVVNYNYACVFEHSQQLVLISSPVAGVMSSIQARALFLSLLLLQS